MLYLENSTFWCGIINTKKHRQVMLNKVLNNNDQRLSFLPQTWILIIMAASAAMITWIIMRTDDVINFLL